MHIFLLYRGSGITNWNNSPLIRTDSSCTSSSTTSSYRRWKSYICGNTLYSPETWYLPWTRWLWSILNTPSIQCSNNLRMFFHDPTSFPASSPPGRWWLPLAVSGGLSLTIQQSTFGIHERKRHNNSSTNTRHNIYNGHKLFLTIIFLWWLLSSSSTSSSSSSSDTSLSATCSALYMNNGIYCSSSCTIYRRTSFKWMFGKSTWFNMRGFTQDTVLKIPFYTQLKKLYAIKHI